MAPLPNPPSPSPKQANLHSNSLSFENLVSLAIYQERLKNAHKVLWRDKGEPLVHLSTLRDCLDHALAGGARSATLAFNVRACFNLILAFIRIRKVPRSQWLGLLRHAVFGEDSFRFAAMLGTFAALYKLLVNSLALPILFPVRDIPPSPFVDSDREDSEDSSSSPDSGLATPGLRRRGPRLSLSAHAQMVLSQRKTRRWHAALAGSISGGLAVMWEKRSRRIVFAQQLFVRGLQGIYNNYSDRWGISIPHGAAIVFALSCGQIMYAFFMRPDTLPRSYVNWIQEASRAPAASFSYNRPDITPLNLTALQSLRERILTGDQHIPRYLPCAGLHPMSDSCLSVSFVRFFEVARWMLPIYSALHFVPTLAFRWKLFHADPARVLAHASVGSLRSSAFLGAFVIFCQAVWCIKHTLCERIMAAPSTSVLRRLLPQELINVLISRYTWWLSGLVTGFALLLEDERRRAELAMYTLPKGLESLWIVARGRGLVGRTGNWGEGVLAAIGTGMVMTIYQNEPEHLSGLVRRILYQFIGPN
ncbi:hypothetical protein C8F01DRAFT_674657 [Mycena amicta]|nr:hypothetical protein C8F01DRAFT_674657 [Mycena amicta]